jgi:hypothetical protein
VVNNRLGGLAGVSGSRKDEIRPTRHSSLNFTTDGPKLKCPEFDPLTLTHLGIRQLGGSARVNRQRSVSIRPDSFEESWISLIDETRITESSYSTD